MNKQAELAVIRARAALVEAQPFLGVLALHLAMVERPDVETAATDGASFFYAPDYVLSLSESERIWLWAHEAGHCGLSHHARIGGRDLETFNRAADYAMNSELARLRVGKEPANILRDAKFDGLGAEEIYSALQAAARKQPQPGNGQPGAGQGNAQGNSGTNGQPGAGNASTGTPAAGNGQPGAQARINGAGGIMKPGNGSEAAAAESADKWQVIARQAAAVAKAQNAGTMPGFAEMVVKELSAPRIDYRELLADLINSRVATDYSFMRPNRRLIGRGVYMPGTIIDALNHVVFAVDTSGSIDQTMLANAASEIIGAMEGGKIAKLTVIFADAAVRHVQEFEIGDDIKLTPRGGGGTRFAPTFRWIEENAPDATAVIYLTDMECGDWGIEPDMPVYWAVHGDSRRFDRLAAAAPFGDAIYIGRLG